jgi:N-carbamoyl-L-amino-acid hydrolase
MINKTKDSFDLRFCKKISSKIFNEVRELTRDIEGVTRESYGKGENVTSNYLINLAKQNDLFIEIDKASNIYFSLNNNVNEKYILIGSHIDSVPMGGNFDGLAGVVAGLTILIEIKNKKIVNLPNLKVLALRGEESAWYGINYIGSKAIFGLLNEKNLNLKHREKDLTLFEAMNTCKVDLNIIKSKKTLLDKKNILAFVEVHIEQGPVLIQKNWPAAIVTGIRGNFRYRNIICKGSAGHSGTIPRWLRNDAVFAASDLIMRMDDHWSSILQHGGDLVLTSGIFFTDSNHHAMSRIPGELYFSFESRSEDEEILLALDDLLRSECKTIEKERGVDFIFDEVIKSKPAKIDDEILKKLQYAAKLNKLKDALIPSGAGHDASVFSNEGIPTGMIFIRNANGSHNPSETMNINDFLIGVTILKDFIFNF